jgi:hypothetical protein
VQNLDLKSDMNIKGDFWGKNQCEEGRQKERGMGK